MCCRGHPQIAFLRDNTKLTAPRVQTAGFPPKNENTQSYCSCRSQDWDRGEQHGALLIDEPLRDRFKYTVSDSQQVRSIVVRRAEELWSTNLLAEVARTRNKTEELKLCHVVCQTCRTNWFSSALVEVRSQCEKQCLTIMRPTQSICLLTSELAHVGEQVPHVDDSYQCLY